ncbi:MAG TPA: zinc ribbon domain-containing protein [Tepidisphaeraceae bacterium]|nr:zinc ribbon domain-containing protein [Tepidisphaeraceae bacterium]
MIRRVFIVLSALSLLLCLAWLALWLRSYWIMDRACLHRFSGGWRPSFPGEILGPGDVRYRATTNDAAHTSLELTSVAGVCHIELRRSTVAAGEAITLAPIQRGYHRTAVDYSGLIWRRLLLFEFNRERPQTTNAGTLGGIELFIPHWPLVLLFAILPSIWFYRLHRHRLRPGFCPTCGYDLRASTDRCPECGTPIVPKEFAA